LPHFVPERFSVPLFIFLLRNIRQRWKQAPALAVDFSRRCIAGPLQCNFSWQLSVLWPA
jgi:hypothetical protein